MLSYHIFSFRQRVPNRYHLLITVLCYMRKVDTNLPVPTMIVSSFAIFNDPK